MAIDHLDEVVLGEAAQGRQGETRIFAQKLAPPVPRLVKLQRPPPEMRIFSPGARAWSITRTRRPRLPASMAHIMPAAPAPTIRTSMSEDFIAPP
jgi:hypothetical protein